MPSGGASNRQRQIGNGQISNGQISNVKSATVKSATVKSARVKSATSNRQRSSCAHFAPQPSECEKFPEPPRGCSGLPAVGSDLRNGNVKGSVLTDYNPPSPPSGSGFHRYMIFIFNEPVDQTISLTPSEKASRDYGTESLERSHERVYGYAQPDSLLCGRPVQRKLSTAEAVMAVELEVHGLAFTEALG
ncbi:phosphatidylethanolamine-binding protein 4 isoform X3 [Lethenteron reissneri]|uniref:phosphatidylethanolamine-binding protein 4 isoform X3 n=1 Tax=Lethenteron reissneri TaxID=7753 RepID=UPI002AB79E41|nr:phosphatidylethanolamine-binding protein 4 isoform X3 [Lethenteron reissneri]